MYQDRNIERDDDRIYFQQRAAEEAARAEKAITPAAKQAHSDLAAMFMRKAAERTSLRLESSDAERETGD